MNKKILIILPILVLAIVWLTFSSQEEAGTNQALPNITWLDQVEFRRPVEFTFREGRDQILRLDYAPTPDYGGRYSGEMTFIPGAHSNTKPPAQSRVLKVITNNAGNPATLFVSGDAGLSDHVYYLYLPGGTMKMVSTTYEDPIIWGKNETERQEQITQFRNTFETMVRSVSIKK